MKTAIIGVLLLGLAGQCLAQSCVSGDPVACAIARQQDQAARDKYQRDHTEPLDSSDTLPSATPSREGEFDIGKIFAEEARRLDALRQQRPPPSPSQEELDRLEREADERARQQEAERVAREAQAAAEEEAQIRNDGAALVALVERSKALEQLEGENPEAAAIQFHNRTEAALLLRDFNGALHWAKKAVDAQPGNEQYLDRWVYVNWIHHYFDAAIPAAQELVNRWPNNTRYHWQLAEILATAGQYESALKEAAEVTRLAPTDAALLEWARELKARAPR